MEFKRFFCKKQSKSKKSLIKEKDKRSERWSTFDAWRDANLRLVRKRYGVAVDFTKILREDFTHADPKSTKNSVKLSFFFCDWGICAC